METCKGKVLTVILVFISSVIANNDLVLFDIMDIYRIDNYQHIFSSICAQERIDIAGVSQSCQEQLRVVCENKSVLLTMLDASSKPWSGLNYSSLLNFGNFDECVDIEHEQELDGKNIRILGKHCTPGLAIPNLEETKAYQLSLCVPDKCETNDFKSIVLNLTGSQNLSDIFVDGGCSTKESAGDFSGGDIAIIVIFAIFFALLVISTLYDVYLHVFNQKSKHLLLIAFSLLSNGKKLLQTSKGKNREQILTFHGLKFISMWWIMAGHNISMWQVTPLINMPPATSFIGEMHSWYLTTAHLAVDTFFYISGFLLAYQYLKQKSQPLSAHLMSVPKLYLHRYLRLTPVVLMLYLYVIGIQQHMGIGPYFPTISEYYKQPCIDYWWSFFLYIQNYYNSDNLCVTHTWYLSADMQMFIVAPISLIPIALNIKKNFKWTMIALLGMNIFFTLLPIINVIQPDFYNEYDTHCKLVDYWIGFMLGAYMREKKDKSFKISKKINILLWVLILGLMLATVLLYKYIEISYGDVANQVFFTIMRPVWCIGLSWIVFSCYHGYGGIVNWLLSLPSMQIGSKLTYCMYLTHGQVILYYALTGRTIKYFSDYTVFYEWCGTFIMTMVVATVATLTFESPIIVVERMLLGGGKRKPPPNIRSNDIANQENKKTEAEQA